MKHIKNLIIDMDGVLWRGETPMPGLAEFFATLQTTGIKFVLATNNAAKTAVQYTEKLARFGIQLDEAQILTSAEATASYLSEQYTPGTAVYVVGDVGLRSAMKRRGFNILTIEQVLGGETAAIVTVGFSRQVSYDELAAGSLLVHKGARFVGTNPDVSFPSEYGPLPGAGSFLALIKAATGVEPMVIGKPGPAIFQDAMKRLGGTPDNTAMVGDRLETDIAGGKAAGIQTILVLTGISTRDDVAANGLKPDYIFADITELAAHLRRSSHDRGARR
jgi:4-nitrophenyl phosphatase